MENLIIGENDDNLIDLSSIQRKKVEHPEPKIQNIPDFDFGANMDKSVIKAAKTSAKMKPHKPKSKTEKKDDKEKQRMVLILQFYVLEFPEKLEAFKGIAFHKKPLEELIELRNQMDGIISSKSGLQKTQMMLTSGIRLIEMVATHTTPIRCEGLANWMVKDPEVLDDIKHIALKRMSLVSVDPEMRLLYKIGTNMLLLHNTNTTKPLAQSEQNVEKLNELNSKFNDI